MNPPLYDCALSLATEKSAARRQNHSSQALAKDFELFVGYMVKDEAKKIPGRIQGVRSRRIKVRELRYKFLQRL